MRRMRHDLAWINEQVRDSYGIETAAHGANDKTFDGVADTEAEP